ncbi:polysaccharide pyruvyl transferase family protein, partial [Vibrio fluvialis]|nr:polysaccharide pyruvyl transferase family protein [Vibrio fluvialis]
SDTIQDKYFAICGNVVSSKEAIFNLTSLVIKIQQEFHLTPVFLVADEKDLEFSDALKQSCNELIIIDNATNIDTVLDIIEKSEFFITGRFHPFIFSLTVGAKVITFSSNTHKIEGVKMLINNCVPNINLKDVTTDFLTVSKFYNSYCDSANIQSIETLKSLLPSSYNKLLEDER